MSKKAYQDQIEKIESRIEELKKENTTDRKRLAEAEVEYENAVNSFETHQINRLHSEITSIKANLENREKQITILENPDNPVRKEAKEQYLQTLNGERSQAEEKADKLHEKVMKLQNSYIEAANEIFQMNQDVSVARRAYLKASGSNDHGGPYLNPTQYGVTIASPRAGQSHYQGGIYL